MSLIQQALKRKLDEQQDGAAPPPLPPAPAAKTPVATEGAAPAAPPSRTKLSLAPLHDLPPAPQAVSATPPPPVPQAQPPVAAPRPVSPEDRAGSSGMKLAVIFLILLVVGVVVFWLLMHSGRPAALSVLPGGTSGAAVTSPGEANKSVRQNADVPPEAARATHQEKNTMASSLLPLPDVVGIHARVEKMKEAVAESRKADAEAEQGVVKPPPVQPLSPVAPVPAPPSQPVVNPPPAATVVAAVPPPALPSASAPGMAWPPVRITGVMARSGKGQQSAIINDSLINVGESLDGMTLVEVRENGVVMEYRRETRVFSVGRKR